MKELALVKGGHENGQGEPQITLSFQLGVCGGSFGSLRVTQAGQWKGVEVPGG